MKEQLETPSLCCPEFRSSWPYKIDISNHYLAVFYPMDKPICEVPRFLSQARSDYQLDINAVSEEKKFGVCL